MTDALFSPPPPHRPALPEPKLERWQPLRLGLVELFHYDSEEFWFKDGHLLLRGNNGTGKSKVLSLTLPFLFDAQLRPSRIEPDGDSGKKMAWNLLMSSYQRRIGYTWIEFGRRSADGVAHYLTLGAGLSAAVGKAQVDSWFFMLEGGDGEDPRIGQDIWLTNDQKMVLTRERLREAIEGRGRSRIFESAQSYRRAVDDRLFQIGTKRYEALMDTLIQLRQPQLSKKPDEAGLSHALTEALPPLPVELLSDVAEALNQLEEDRIQLEDIRSLERAIKHFEQRYRTYAGTVTRRQTRELRQAQTGFDKASEARNKAHADLKDAQGAEDLARDHHTESRQRLAAARTRLQTLQSDPANQDANRLSQSESDARQRKTEAEAAQAQRDQARHHLNREQERSRQSSQRSEAARGDLLAARAGCAEAAETACTHAALSDNLLFTLGVEALPPLAPAEITRAATLLRDATSQRRSDVRHLESRHAAAHLKQQALLNLQASQRERQTELEDAAVRRLEADEKTEAAGNALIDAWQTHCASLTHLRFDPGAPLEQMVDWVARPEGANPIQEALNEAYRQSAQDHASQRSALGTEQSALESEREALCTERDRLLAGHDATPAPPATRAENVRNERAGAPLWRLVDFQPELDAGQRAGLEAAFEASGLLDAWLSPDGALTNAQGVRLLDSSWALRAPVAGHSLARALKPDVPEGSAVSSARVASLLGCVAYGGEDHGESESWVSEQGAYRLGVLAGAWHKPQAVYIGHTARASARARRIQEIADRLGEVELLQQALQQQLQRLLQDEQAAQREWKDAPADQALRDAMAAAASAQRQVLQSRQRLDLADAQCRVAEAELQSAQETLVRDAADLQLPSTREDLSPIHEALDRFADAHQRLTLATREWCSAWPEHQTQQEREAEATEVLSEREASLLAASERAAEAQARYAVLQSMIGAKVETLRQQLHDASAEVASADGAWDAAQTALAAAGEKRAVAASQADTADAVLAERTAERARAIERLQRFADSSLLASALPDFAVPDAAAPWTLEASLSLARRAEQALVHIADDEAAWARTQRQVAEDLTELQRSLSSLGQQATSEPNDWGFSVHVIYQNRPERPDALALRLADEVAQRSELLTAKEREVLENHLQAEIAAEIQRLMRAADKQVQAINEELHKRPTSTGVRYRLQWLALTPEQGAPAGLEVARERLLNRSADMWSPEDRSAVGAMLQQQIAAERAQADASAAGSSLVDQLAKALDYRRWHRFSVQRHQDGQWRKLSGPASSGERALGLTVPLFAAIASFYGRGGSPHAPRLILLDEAFAGIDDAARAHCMALIREFDLDFVITSEREWACYAELPGVSICQLQRREGVDAVFVSRWAWDGRAKRREDDPDRRFPRT